MRVVSEHGDRHAPRPGSRYHGDQAADPGLLDFAVNVRHGAPPSWLVERLAGRLADLARYPSAADHEAAVAAVAARHGVPADNVLLLSGGSEGFSLLPALQPSLAALIAPSFTEPEAVFAAAGVPVHHVVLESPFELSTAAVPAAADLVVLGNPDQPDRGAAPPGGGARAAPPRPGAGGRRGVRRRGARRAGVAGRAALPDVLVLRSLTKTWSLAGLRIGYALGAPEVLARLSSRRPHWPLGTLQLEAIAACCAPAAVAEPRREAEGAGAGDRALMRPARWVSMWSTAVRHSSCSPSRRRVDRKHCTPRGSRCDGATRSSAWAMATCGPRCGRSGRCSSTHSREVLG